MLVYVLIGCVPTRRGGLPQAALPTRLGMGMARASAEPVFRVLIGVSGCNSVQIRRVGLFRLNCTENTSCRSVLRFLPGLPAIVKPLCTHSGHPEPWMRSTSELSFT